jgi:hypothetical protein
MPLHRGSAKALSLHRLLSRVIANTTAAVRKAALPMVGDAARHVDTP